MKRSLISAMLGLLLSSTALPAQDAAVIGAQVESWYARARRIAPGDWGVVVADHAGNVLWSTNESTPLIPASTVKLLTTGFARSAVGGEARRPTRVIGEGQLDVASGTWQGRWALELNGDVTLERADRGGPTLQELANQLVSIGVKRLIGPLVVTSASGGDPQSRFPSAWEDRHRGRIFAPLIGETTLNEGLVSFSVSPGSKVGTPAVLVGAAPSGVGSLVNITAKTVAGSRNSSLRMSSLGNGRYQLSGSIGSRARARGFTMVAQNPQMVLEAVWSHATEVAGIDWIKAATSISGQATPGDRRVLAEIVSQPFDSVAHEINSRSLNIGAEMMLLWGGGLSNAADRLNQHIASVTGMNTGFHLVDGSGLSSTDRVSPIVFTTYLARYPLTATGKNFPLLLPANGSGTLRKLATGLPEAGVVRAKTGTLGNVSTLVGYLGRNDGTLLIAAMYNGGHSGTAKSMQWDLFRRLGAKGVVLPTEIGGEPALTVPNQDGVPHQP